MSTRNPWDALSPYFDTSRSEVASGAADNVLIAWPVILRFIARYARRGDAVRVLDYGCGGGGFCHELQSRGFQVVGVDSSRTMIDTARKAYSAEIEFQVADAGDVRTFGQFDIVTAIMVLQFVDDIAGTMRDLAAVLRVGGVLIFAIFNPAYVIERIAAKRTFYGFDSSARPTVGWIEFGGGIRVPTFIRSASEYNLIAQTCGLTALLEDYPPFTQEFLSQYPQTMPSEHAEYLILGYRKAVLTQARG